MKKSKSFSLPIFPFDFHIVCKKTINKGLKYFDFEIDESKLYEAVTIEENHNIYMIFCKKYLSIKVIAHECSHAVDTIYNFTCSVENTNEELRAYLYGYVFNKVYNKLQKELNDGYKK